jgi:hypothetical protein
MSKPHIIIHIGAEKTGSTSLQQAFSQLSPKISKKIRYPGDDELPDTFHGRHAGLVKASGCPWFSQGKKFDERNYPIREKYKNEYFKKLENIALKSNKENWSYLLLSEENLSSRLKYDNIENLTKEFDKFSSKKTAVLIIREQFSAYTSQYSTFITNGQTDGMREFLKNHMYSIYFDYYEIVKKWEACGWSVLLGLYSSSVFSEFSRLLFKITGEQIEIDNFEKPKNISLSYLELVVMRCWNKFPFKRNRLFKKIFFVTLLVARKARWNPDYNLKYKDIKDEISDYYYSGNSKVALQYFGRTELFTK